VLPVSVSITGLVIGGGADGIYKIVKVFTSYFEPSPARLRERNARWLTITS
jgi:hypothetical protein